MAQGLWKTCLRWMPVAGGGGPRGLGREPQAGVTALLIAEGRGLQGDSFNPSIGVKKGFHGSMPALRQSSEGEWEKQRRGDEERARRIKIPSRSKYLLIGASAPK